MEMDAAAASFTWTSALIQDPNDPRENRMVLKRVSTEHLQVAQDNRTWTCSVVDDPKNPRVKLRMVPVKASQVEALQQPQVSWFPCLTDDSDTETDSPVSPRQVTTTRKRDTVTVAKKKGTGSALFKSMRRVLQEKISQSTAANFRPKLKVCEGRRGKPCHGECGQGVACQGQRPPPAKHHFLIDKDYFKNRRKCEVIKARGNRKRKGPAQGPSSRPRPYQR